MSVSFKQVVETFAEQNGLLFHPKMDKHGIGSTDHVEGKQLYLFGPLLCYIDQNVLFVQSATSGAGRTWRPVDLEEALEMTRKA
jgi:hypothetical protein